MNVKFCSAVKQPGDWCFFSDRGQKYFKAILPIPPVVVSYEAAGELRLIVLPVGGSGWQWDGNEDSPTLSPSIRTEIVSGYTKDNPPQRIMREIYHGHLQGGIWNP